MPFANDGVTVHRRSAAELAAHRTALQPRHNEGCGHHAINAGDYYLRHLTVCVDCYRERELQRLHNNTLNQTEPVVNLARAGHKRRPQGARTGRFSAKKPNLSTHTTEMGYVYCIGEEDRTLAVKVGYARDAQFRIADLQTGNPRKLVILGVLRGTRQDERDLHARYIKDNVLGEWFRPTAELLSEFDIDPESVIA